MTMSALTGPAATRRGPGRPRVHAHDDAILAAALTLIDGGSDITVARIVELSGVGRAAIYRRWPSLTDLIADALNVGRNDEPVTPGASTADAFVFALLGHPSTVGEGYPERRLRRRLQMALADRTLQRRYWEAHVQKRRVGMLATLRAGVDSGELREDLDLEAGCDLLAGVFYYQLVVRGDSITDLAVQDRCRHAITIALRGMSRTAE